MPLWLDVFEVQTIALAYIKRLQPSFKEREEKNPSDSPLFPSISPSQKFSFVCRGDSFRTGSSSPPIGAKLASVVVVSWEAFAQIVQHPWECDKKLQGDRPTGLDYFFPICFPVLRFSRFICNYFTCNFLPCKLSYIFVNINLILLTDLK